VKGNITETKRILGYLMLPLKCAVPPDICAVKSYTAHLQHSKTLQKTIKQTTLF